MSEEIVTADANLAHIARLQEQLNHRNHGNTVWRRQHPDQAAEGWKKQRERVGEQFPERIKEYYHRRRARKLGNGGDYTAQQWADLCTLYDYRCLCCGRQEPEIALTVDHIVPLALGGSNDIDNIQPLCKSCNSRKATRSIDYRR